jgi:D-lactate dehydrogenase
VATIAFFDTANWEPSFVKRNIGALFGHKLHFYPESLSHKHIEKIKDVDIISLFVQSKLTADMIQQLPNLRMVTLRSTGYDNVDVLECAKHGIPVCNVPAYGNNTVAEHTFGLLLSLARHIHHTFDRDKEMNFTIKDFVGFDLKGKVLGIIGGGRIGMNVVKIAQGFGMKIMVYDKVQNSFYAELLNFEYVELNRIYKESDIISLHIPYLAQTHHMIDLTAVKKMKRGVVLLNTSRGALVDTDALIYGLNKGIISKAGLDVLEEEEFLTHPESFNASRDSQASTLAKNRKIISNPNVLYTPHSAFNTVEALHRIEETTLENIRSFFHGKIVNQVKP